MNKDQVFLGMYRIMIKIECFHFIISQKYSTKCIISTEKG